MGQELPNWRLPLTSRWFASVRSLPNRSSDISFACNYLIQLDFQSGNFRIQSEIFEPRVGAAFSALCRTAGYCCTCLDGDQILEPTKRVAIQFW